MPVGFRLSAQARSDIISILATTTECFGFQAHLRYERFLVTAMRDLAAGHPRIGSVPRPELGQDVWSYHLRYSRERARHESGIVRHPRHIVLYRSLRPGIIGIGRVLYDGMDIERHAPAAYENE